MSRSTLTRLGTGVGVVVGTTALVAGSLMAPTSAATAPTPARQAQPGDSRSADALRAWVGKQLTNNLVYNNTTNAYDLGLSADFALALDELGDKAAARTVGEAVVSRAFPGWVSSTTGEVTTTYAGPLARSIATAQLVGTNPTNIAGANQVTRLEELVAKDEPIAGRVQDDKNSAGDSADVVAQLYAARALGVANSTKATQAMTYLLKQQCSGGYFRAALTPDKAATPQACTAGAVDSAPSLDTSALAVINLVGLKSDKAAQEAVTRAVTWLKTQQAADGSFGTPASAATTGLAAWALSVGGATAEAEKAAGWSRGVQVVDIAPCANNLVRETGAIAPNAQALSTARTASLIAVPNQPEWRRAGMLSLVALRHLPKPDKAPALTAPKFVRADRSARITVSGLAAGETGCLSFGPVTTAIHGAGKDQIIAVKMPAGTKEYVVRLNTLASAGGAADAANATTTALAARNLPFGLRTKTIRRGNEQRVKARGLVEGEKVLVRFRGRIVGEGVADADGRAIFTFPATGRRGPAKIVVRGEFPDRRRVKQITVR